MNWWVEWCDRVSARWSKKVRESDREGERKIEREGGERETEGAINNSFEVCL